MDSRFPTHYMTDRRVVRASPEQFRLFVFATAWAVSNMTDGHIDQEDLPLIPFASTPLAEGLVKADLWAPTERGWVITDFAKTQTSAAQIEAALLNRRKLDAERQKKKYERDKEKGTQNPDPDPTDNPTSREDHVRIEGKERKGKERQGKALYEGTSQVTSDKPALSQVNRSSRPLRSFPDCSTPGCDGKLNQAAVDAGNDFCADCAWSGRAAS
jgi:hypothetical protein